MEECMLGVTAIIDKVGGAFVFLSDLQ